jgi:hypothetical protein
VSRLCEFYPGICLATEEKARENLSQVKKNLSQWSYTTGNIEFKLGVVHFEMLHPRLKSTLE